MKFYSTLHKPFVHTWVIVLILLTSVIGPGMTNAAGSKNIVILRNYKDNRLSVKGNVELNRLSGSHAKPVNLADARASCSDCDTLAVALQINLVSKTARTITAQNTASAVNAEECAQCRTAAWAFQYVIMVDNPKDTPREVSALIKEMDRELQELRRSDRHITVAEAEARINNVIQRFSSLAESLYIKRDRETVQ